MSEQASSVGDPIAPNCEVIEVHVAELKQAFNAIDPSPFREKDHVPRDAPLALLVYLDRPAGCRLLKLFTVRT